MQGTETEAQRLDRVNDEARSRDCPYRAWIRDILSAGQYTEKGGEMVEEPRLSSRTHRV